MGTLHNLIIITRQEVVQSKTLTFGAHNRSNHLNIVILPGPFHIVITAIQGICQEFVRGHISFFRIVNCWQQGIAVTFTCGLHFNVSNERQTLFIGVGRVCFHYLSLIVLAFMPTITGIGV